ncbi:HAMP domain-containing histidine kinase [Candidatus Saccharibacteria bacterium]|nr:HAMP domain-containing histidine kinase [Candidatus Saccharibacteria bacterium]
MNWYQAAKSELDAGLRRRDKLIEKGYDFLRRSPPKFIDERLEIRDEAIASIQRRIIMSNIVIIVIGGLGSYFLAHEILKPIEQAHEAQKQFTADASHELRTPLTAMRTEIEVALRDDKITKEQAINLLGSNLEELEKMSSLSENLLLLSAQDFSKNQTNLSSIEITKLLEDVLIKVTPIAKDKSITIENKLQPAKVQADPKQLSELLTILVENAIKYSQKGRQIVVSGESNSKQQYELSVSDSGIGIDQKDQQKLFDRFYRVDESRSSQTSNGFGLGLSIAQQIAKNHSTEVIVNSELGKGSKFSFKLKLL